MYRILVVGGGYVGSAVVAYFRSKNQKVWVTTRSNEKAKQFELLGAQPIVCDLTKPQTLSAVPDVQFVVIAVAPDSRDPENYRKVYIEGAGNLLSRLKQNPIAPFVVYISSTGVFPDVAGEWVDENMQLKPDSERSGILLQAEEQVLKSGLPAVIFRLGGIYGPGRNQIQNLKSGKWPESSEDEYVNLIHLDDVVGGVMALFKHAEAGQVYIGADDEPAKRSELLAWLSGQLGIENRAKFDIDGKISGKRCRNAKLKSLGFQFKFPSFKKGYESLIGDGPAGAGLRAKKPVND